MAQQNQNGVLGWVEGVQNFLIAREERRAEEARVRAAEAVNAAGDGQQPNNLIQYAPYAIGAAVVVLVVVLLVKR
jgi:hypothetical protein